MIEEQSVKERTTVLQDDKTSVLTLANQTYKELVITNIFYLIIIQCALNLFILAFMHKLKLILWNTVVSFVVTLIAVYVIAVGYHITRRLLQKWKSQLS